MSDLCHDPDTDANRWRAAQLRRDLPRSARQRPVATVPTLAHKEVELGAFGRCTIAVMPNGGFVVKVRQEYGEVPCYFQVADNRVMAVLADALPEAARC